MDQSDEVSTDPWEPGVKHLFIAGKWAPAADGGTSQTINPFDATPLDTLAEASGPTWTRRSRPPARRSTRARGASRR